MTNNILKFSLIVAFLLLFGQTASAEVLEKFGGCQLPRYLKWLSGFVIAIGFLIFFRKKRTAQLLVYLSLVYIFFDVFLYYLAAKKIIPSWFDQAQFDFYQEIQGCSQFAYIGYWQQSWLMVDVPLAL